MLTHNKLSSIVILIMDFFIINYFVKKWVFKVIFRVQIALPFSFLISLFLLVWEYYQFIIVIWYLWLFIYLFIFVSDELFIARIYTHTHLKKKIFLIRMLIFRSGNTCDYNWQKFMYVHWLDTMNLDREQVNIMYYKGQRQRQRQRQLRFESYAIMLSYFCLPARVTITQIPWLRLLCL